MSRLAEQEDEVNEELRRQIRERRDEHAKKFQRTASSADSEARRALEWVLDLLDAQPAAVSLPEEAEPSAHQPYDHPYGDQACIACHEDWPCMFEQGRRSALRRTEPPPVEPQP